MASLTEVVEELQGQNDTLEDVKSTLRGILDVDMAAQREAASQELKDKEAAIEARRSKAANMSGAPKSVGAGVSKAFGIDSLLGGLQGLGAGFLAGASTLMGGASLGGLLGLALGKTFIGAAGAYFGSQMFSDEMVNKLIPDVIEDINITKDIKVGDIAAELGGALLFLFGPKLIKGIFKTGFGYISSLMIAKIAVSSGQDLLGEDGKKNIDDETKKGKKRFGKGLSKGIGIAGLLAFVGAGIGEEVGKLTGSEELGSAISAAAMGASLGSMFGPKGMIIGAAIGLAYVAGSMLYDWMAGKREEAATALKEDLDKQSKEFSDALESGDLEAAKQSLETSLSKVDYGTNENEKLANAQFAAQNAELADALANSGQFELAQEERFKAAKLAYKGADTVDEKMAAVQQLQQSHGYDKQYAISLLDPKYFNNYGDEAFANALNALPNTFKDLSARPDNSDNTSMPALEPIDPYSKLRENVTSPYMIPFGPKGGLEGSGSTEQGLLPELPMRPLGSELMKPSVDAGSLSVRNIEEFIRTGKFPEYDGGATPMSLPPLEKNELTTSPETLDSTVSSPVAQQTIDADDVKTVNNNNVTINNIDNSDNKQTTLNRAGDAPTRLLGSLGTATDMQYLSKLEKMFGVAHRVGNAF